MLTLHMQENYSRQSEFDVECQPRHFTLKYGESIQCIKTDCVIEPLNHHDVFKLFQTKAALMWSCLYDAWAAAGLLYFPPGGCVSFTSVLRSAEASGVWPAVTTLFDVTKTPDPLELYL